MCGLKHCNIRTICYLNSHTLRGCVDWNNLVWCWLVLSKVTPCVGVWIETIQARQSSRQSIVTPCVGVWIETSILQQRVNLPLLSHPAWVCGLKQVNDSFKQCRNRSHTLRGCVDWNRKIPHNGKQKHQCHTLRGCVDWNIQILNWLMLYLVTPCVGVWIETWLDGREFSTVMSHPAWVCGLKLVSCGRVYLSRCHTLRGCVDWN